jgi:hypothetical protein
MGCGHDHWRSSSDGREIVFTTDAQRTAAETHSPLLSLCAADQCRPVPTDPTSRIGVAVIIQHEDTKGTKDHEAPPPHFCLWEGRRGFVHLRVFAPSC